MIQEEGRNEMPPDYRPPDEYEAGEGQYEYLSGRERAEDVRREYLSDRELQDLLEEGILGEGVLCRIRDPDGGGLHFRGRCDSPIRYHIGTNRTRSEMYCTCEWMNVERLSEEAGRYFRSCNETMERPWGIQARYLMPGQMGHGEDVRRLRLALAAPVARPCGPPQIKDTMRRLIAAANSRIWNDGEQIRRLTDAGT